MGIKECKRTAGGKRTKDIYLVVCEGKNKTEFTYLSNFKCRSSKINLYIEKSEATSPKDMISTTIRFMKKYGMDREDRAFCLMDMDVDSTRAETIKKLSQKNPSITIIRSNACFEVWFLLHFVDNPRVENSSKNTKYELENYIRDYKENMDVYNKVPAIKSNTDLAIARAKALRKKHRNNNIALDCIDAIPYTEVDILIEEIKSGLS